MNLEHYIDDIETYMRKTDENFQKKIEGKVNLPESLAISLDMRKILIKWLAKVAAQSRYKSETLHMCVQLVDLMLMYEG